MMSYKVTSGRGHTIYRTKELAIMHALSEVCSLMKKHTNVIVTQSCEDQNYSWKVTTEDGDEEIDVTAII